MRLMYFVTERLCGFLFLCIKICYGILNPLFINIFYFFGIHNKSEDNGKKKKKNKLKFKPNLFDKL